MSQLDRFEELVSQLLEMTLKGKFASKGQIARHLSDFIEPGSGELFEQVLLARSQHLDQQVANETDELKQAKAIRGQRAIKMVVGAWEKVQQDFVASREISQAIQRLTQANAAEELGLFLTVIDPNRQTSLNRDQLKQLAQELQNHSPSHPEADHYSLRRLGNGLTQALAIWSVLEPHLLGWLYEAAQGSIGFGGGSGASGPWAFWAKKVETSLLKTGLEILATGQPMGEWIAEQTRIELEDWLVMALVFQWIQRGLIAWFDKQAYDPKAGPQLSISVYLSFTVLWYEMAHGYQRASKLNSLSRQSYEQACLQVSLQLLRTFARQSYFPLYGGIFASFGGGYLKMTLDYLDIPLKWVEGVQEKGRILTLLGTSQYIVGHLDQAIAFHQEALELSRQVGDQTCEVANLNHLSRCGIVQEVLESAVNYAQRALLLSRQRGDMTGQANALANLGYAQVLQAQLDERPDLDVYDVATNYLKQGLTLAERAGDRQSEAMCCLSLGIAYNVQAEYDQAIQCLVQGLSAVNAVGDFALRGKVYGQLAEAHYAVEHWEQASLYAALGMYLLHQIASPQWRQVAGLLSVIQGQHPEEVTRAMEKYKTQIHSILGLDGYDVITDLLTQYRQS